MVHVMTKFHMTLIGSHIHVYGLSVDLMIFELDGILTLDDI